MYSEEDLAELVPYFVWNCNSTTSIVASELILSMNVTKFLELLLLALVMGITTFLGGLVPLKLELSSAMINKISLFSMGILVGTSLVLIIPEGIETLYKSLDKDSAASAPTYIGLSLLFGFIVMYILDGLPVILASLNINLKFDPRAFSTSNGLASIPIKDSLRSILDSSLTLGLIFHATVDGISLGSSFVGDDVAFRVIFFIVIIIHKLPTAFSLTSILMKENLNHQAIQLHLIVFSLMSPLSSIITYLIITFSKNNNQFVIGILFLFSAGTFLYVVNHVMTEVSAGGDNPEFSSLPPSTAVSEETVGHHHPKLTGIEFLISIAGMIVPIGLSFIGDH